MSNLDKKNILYLSLGDKKTKEFIMIEDLMKDKYYLSIMDWKKVLKDEEQVKNADIVLIRSVYDYEEYPNKFKKFLKIMQKYKHKVYNNPKIIKDNYKKKYLTYFNSVPDTNIINKQKISIDEIKNIINSELQKYGKIVIKPVISNSGKNIHLISSEDDINNIDFMNIQKIIETKGLIVQKFLEGIKNGEYSVIIINDYKYIVHKTNDKDFRIHPFYGGRVTKLEKNNRYYQKLITFASMIIYKYLSINKLTKNDILFARIDIVIDNEKLYLMEIEIIDCVLFMDKNALEYFVKQIEKKIIKFSAISTSVEDS